MNAMAGQLPRLLCLADVPVEASYHGSALVYRLLESYPAEKLTIIEAGTQASLPERRLPGVAYHQRLMPLVRLQSTRLHYWYVAAGLRGASLRARQFKSLARARQPQAVLSVTHGYSWLSAADIAEDLGVPLHLICHDEWAREGDMQDWKDRQFAHRYRLAATRLCVSPFMAEEYERRYGVRGDVLYPSRAKENPTYNAPPSVRCDRPLTGAFAGAALHDPGNRRTLSRIADALGRVGGVLKIFGPYGPSDLTALGLHHSHVRAMGLLKSAELIDALRLEADFLIAPMSFLEVDRNAVSNGFPSKMTDYTAAALPILAVAPDYSSLAKWCRREREAALLVDADDVAQIEMAIRKLGEVEMREAGARAAARAGMQYFAPQIAAGLLISKLLGPKVSSSMSGPVSVSPSGE